MLKPLDVIELRVAVDSWEQGTVATVLEVAPDSVLADAVIKRDDDVDKLYHSSLEALQGEMQRDPGTVPSGTLLLFVVSIIERVGDRAQNIAWHTKDIYG